MQVGNHQSLMDYFSWKKKCMQCSFNWTRDESFKNLKNCKGVRKTESSFPIHSEPKLGYSVWLHKKMFI